MAFTYDPTTSRGKVRLLVADTDEETQTNQIFTDAEVDAFLVLENNEVHTAAAAACESIAASTARSAIAWKALNESIDKKSIPDLFMKLATKYRKRAALGVSEEVDSFDYTLSQFGEDISEYVGDIIT